MVSPGPGDPTPLFGTPADSSPIGRTASHPALERTPGDDLGSVDWDKIAALEDFQRLLHRKARFILPAGIFFIVYCFALPALVGYLRAFDGDRAGPANIANLFTLSQFFIAWIVAALYVRVANIFDRNDHPILDDAPSVRKPTGNIHPTLTYDRLSHRN